MRELLHAIERWKAGGVPAALVRTVEVKGFGAAQYDNAMVVGRDGQRAGEVLRGVSDRSVASVVDAVLDDGTARLVDFTLAEPDADGAGLSCGGQARLLVEPVAALPELLWDEVRVGHTVALATVLDHPGAKPATLVVTADAVAGSVGDGALDPQAQAEARALLQDERNGRRKVDLDEGRLVIDKVVPRTRVLAVGGGEVIEALVDVGRSLGWLVDVVDGGEAIEASRRLGPADALVITTHDPVLGPDVLGAALGSRTFFVGALGSRGTQARRAERLAEMGFGLDDLARVHGPVGLDLGARSPAETALSICAEILAVRSGRETASLRDRSGPINA
jgi:xanthine dehydrogenase accessory factor